eukprot:178125_1
MDRRIGRWIFLIVNKYHIINREWIELDCLWYKFDVNSTIIKMFENNDKHSKFTMMFIGASNYERAVKYYWSNICPNIKLIKSMCPKYQSYNLRMYWNFFRGCCYMKNGVDQCADKQTKFIRDGMFECDNFWPLDNNITFLTTGLWLHKYSNYSFMDQMYEGIKHIINNCSSDNIMFWKQTFAVHNRKYGIYGRNECKSSQVCRSKMGRFINSHIENMHHSLLKKFGDNDIGFTGVFWEFEKTYSLIYNSDGADDMHQDAWFYAQHHNNDIFNEIFRYIHSDYEYCQYVFNETCVNSIKSKIA